MHYLDNAATTRLLPQVAQAVSDALLNHWGNPSSLYGLGADAEAQLEKARQSLADALGCRPGEVFFTAGGTEADNIALLGAARARKNWGKKLVATGYEHPAAAEPLRALAKNEGFELVEIAPGRDGAVDPQALLDAVDKATALVCAMQVNNETGALLDVAALAAGVKERNNRCFVHVDGVQGFCKYPISLSATAIDGYAVSAHKLHGPKGVGALYLRGGKPGNFLPPFGGGGQEHGIRPGTQNVAGAVGFAIAVQLAHGDMAAHSATVEALRTRLLDGLGSLPGVAVLSPPKACPGIVMLAMPAGLRSQVVLNHLDALGVCVSSGSACKGGAQSHTLQAMGLPAAVVDTAIRVSFCGHNTPQDVDALLEGLRSALQKLARASG